MNMIIMCGRGSGKTYTRDILRRLSACEDAFIAFGGDIIEPVILTPPDIGRAFNQFEKAGIVLTDEQYKALDNLARAFTTVGREFEEFTNRLVNIMMPIGKSLSLPSEGLDQNYSQTHKPWKKSKFYY